MVVAERKSFKVKSDLNILVILWQLTVAVIVGGKVSKFLKISLYQRNEYSYE